ncbi:translation initiation factor IF-2 [Streptomyces sp. MMG1121]|uniref:translation initiation factor IF-2 n=1 Tax=Streptomyces sp. MMG1121 TaxID=1415544 RepID=UPI000A91591F|nr:translation initiation factor IF-2 [Streptomyces sp. MMG1121]
MSGKGSGGGTAFEDMSHEQMLAWLDQADPGMVQAAADRLTAAAKEIRKIAEELKVRPQWVEWKGEGAHAFRTWSADLANSTLRLGDFSEGAGKWLSEASGAIAHAQASIPRDTKGAQANPDAANAAHNDPDTGAVSTKPDSEPAALAAHKEKVRLEAAAQMRKLGQTYEWSATQMNRLERPKFPPPPTALVPGGTRSIDGSEAKARPGGIAPGAASSPDGAGVVHVAQGRDSSTGTTAAGGDVRKSPVVASPAHVVPVEAEQPTRMGIDSVASLPQAPHTPSTMGGLPGPSHADAGATPATPTTGMLPSPIAGGPKVTPGPLSPRMPSGRLGPSVPSEPPGLRQTPIGGRTPAMPELGGRTSALPEQGATPSTPGRMQSGSRGVIGGRPVPSPAGNSSGAIPRGTVVGAEEPTARGPVGIAAGARSSGQVAGRQATGPGSRLPVRNSGVIGDNTKQPGRTGARSSSAVGGAVERGGISGGKPTAARGAGARSGGTRQAPQAASTRREDTRRSGRNNRTEDEDEVRRQQDRRYVPPVVD